MVFYGKAILVQEQFPQAIFRELGHWRLQVEKEALSMALINCATVGTVYKFEDANDRIFQFIKQASKVNYFIGKEMKGSSGTLTITKTKAVNTLTYANAIFSGTAVGSDGSKIVITEGVIVNAQVN